MNPEADDALLAMLGELLSTRNEPPAELVEIGKGLFTWRTVDAELAAVSFDSLVDAGSSTRAADGPRMLVFAAGEHAVDVEVLAGPEGRRLIGQLTPPGPAEVRLRTMSEVVHTDADDLGRFVLPLGPPSVAALWWTVPSGGAYVSTAVVL